MMTYARNRSAWRVGLLAIAGAAAFTMLFVASTNRVVGGQRARIWVRLPNAEGLQRGAAVLLHGVQVGEVKKLSFDDGAVVAAVKLTQAVPIDTDARAELVAADLFGRQSVVLRPAPEGGTGVPLADGDTLTGTSPAPLTGRIDALGRDVGRLVSDSTIALLRAALGGTGRAATQVGGLAVTADRLLAEQRQALGTLTREAGLLTTDLRGAVGAADLPGLRVRMGESANRLASATARMDTAAAALVRVLALLEHGEGSAGRLLRDAALYERTNGALAALEALLTDIRANPKRYITIDIF